MQKTFMVIIGTVIALIVVFLMISLVISKLT